MAEIARLAALQGAEINEAKKVLATEATALLHGRAKAEAAAETAQQTFEQGALGRGPADGRDRPAELAAGLGVLTAFVKAGLVKSNGEARRQIAGGGLRVNDAAVADERAKLTPGDVTRRGHQALARQEAPRAAETHVTSSPRRRGPSDLLIRGWMPACAGMTVRFDYSAAFSAVGEGLRSSASRAVSRALAAL